MPSRLFMSSGDMVADRRFDFARANVLKQAASLNGFHSPYMLDGVTYSYTPDDYTPMKTLYISIFNGKDWDISDRPVTE
jgi:hypothetical protein